MQHTDLSTFNNSWYTPGASRLTQWLWYGVNAFVVNSYLFPFNALKIGVLRAFGAKIGTGVVIKPKVNIKYPWLLRVGDFTWIGEGVWIDNLAKVRIGNHCCVSQGAILLCGNHNYKKASFDLMVGEIVLQDGVWIGAQSMVGPGVTCYSHSILSAHSFTSKNLDAYGIYQGNPAQKLKNRTLE